MEKFVLAPGGALRGALFKRLLGRDVVQGQLAPASLVGAYRITRLVARSASATVYWAVPEGAQTETLVAIQVMEGVNPPDSPCRLSATVLGRGRLEDGREWFALEISDAG